MVLSASEAREIIEKVIKDNRDKVFEDIANYSKRGFDSIGFLELSVELQSELKVLGYTIVPVEGGFNVIVPKIDSVTTNTEIDKPVYTDDTLVNKPIEGEVLDNDSI